MKKILILITLISLAFSFSHANLFSCKGDESKKETLHKKCNKLHKKCHAKRCDKLHKKCHAKRCDSIHKKCHAKRCDKLHKKCHAKKSHLNGENNTYKQFKILDK